MAGETVLIAAFSGRSLAQSARRAGYSPLVADAFGDLDAREAAEDFRVLDGAMQNGFRAKPLVAALDSLSREADRSPMGLVLGSGFEDKPQLVAALAGRYRLIGSDAAVYRLSKSPTSFFAMLDRLGISHPDTQTTPPDQPGGWISKRVGGSGGRHIRDCRTPPKALPRRYFQRRLEGDRLSISAVFEAPGRATLFRVTRQWISPSPEHPYRFGGCVCDPDIDPALEAALATAAGRVGLELQLAGMTSFDFLVADGKPHLLEVNPRPGASLDVLDDAHGSLFAAHIAAWTRTSSVPPLSQRRGARAIAIAHADRGSLTLPNVRWPAWSADRGAPGTFVPHGAPLATVFAEGATADPAEALARARLAELEDLIYGHAEIFLSGAPH